MQYLRYTQFLASDPASSPPHTISSYTCQEGARYTEKESGREIESLDELLSRDYFVRVEKEQAVEEEQAGTSEHGRTHWELTDLGRSELIVTPVHVEKVQIL